MQRIVTQLPLAELWNEMGPIASKLVRELYAEDIRELLRAGPVQFVVANVGDPLRWVPVAECFQFWKSELQGRVADPAGASLEEYPGVYCYFASEWEEYQGQPVVMLTIAH